MSNQIVTMKWTLGQANRVRDTLILRHRNLTSMITELSDPERTELGEITDILARDFDWRPER